MRIRRSSGVEAFYCVLIAAAALTILWPAAMALISAACRSRGQGKPACQHNLKQCSQALVM